MKGKFKHAPMLLIISLFAIQTIISTDSILKVQAVLGEFQFTNSDLVLYSRSGWETGTRV